MPKPKEIQKLKLNFSRTTLNWNGHCWIIIVSVFTSTNQEYSIYDDIEKIIKALFFVLLQLVTTLEDTTL